MIARLRGRAEPLGENRLIMDVGGVGYLVHCSGRTLAALPAGGAETSLEIETLMREDRLELYGFSDRHERDCFRLLTGVQGVGMRVALAVLTALRPDELAVAVAAGDKAAVMRANGVGARLALRIVGELKDRIGDGFTFTPAVPVAGPAGGAAAAPPSAVNDAVSALANLGYSRTEAFSAVTAAARKAGGETGTADLIRAALAELAR